MPTDTSEAGLEALIVRGLLERGWVAASPKDYHRTFCLDLAQPPPFVQTTSLTPGLAAKLAARPEL